MRNIFTGGEDSDRLKIAIVPHPQNAFPPQIGSVAKIIWESTRRLASKCEVTIFVRREPDQEKFSHIEGIKIRRVSTAFDEKIVLRIVDRLQRHLGLEKFALFRSYLYVWFILKTAFLIRRHGYHVVHIHNYSQFVPIIRFFNSHSKIILHMNCHWLVEMNLKTTTRRMRGADMIISPCASITKQTRQRFPAQAAKCITVPNGVDTNCFSKQSGELVRITRDTFRLNGKEVVLFVGRITPEKGVHVLLEAMGLVKKDFPNAVLVVAGADYLSPISARVKTDALYRQMEKMKKNYRRHLHGLIDRHSLNVVFSGYKYAGQLATFYSMADVVVLPTFEEAGPLPILEAMSCQAPLVSTEVDGVKDYVPRGAGFLVRPNEATALAEKINACLNDAQLGEEMGRSGRQWVEAKFTWDHVAETLQSVYFSLIQQPNIVKESAYELEATA